jgi:hypothetical protein
MNSIQSYVVFGRDRPRPLLIISLVAMEQFASLARTAVQRGHWDQVFTPIMTITNLT